MTDEKKTTKEKTKAKVEESKSSFPRLMIISFLYKKLNDLNNS